jgi:hypothetical protein
VAPDGGVVHDGPCAATFTPDVTGRPDGSYVLTVTARDTAGNVSSAVTSTYLLDSSAPSDPVFTVEPATSSDRAPRWELTAEAGATLTCRLRGPDGVLIVSEGCSGSWTADLTGLPDGTYTLEVRARDAAGNVSGWATSGYVLDTAAPAPPAVTAPSGPSSSRSWTVTWTGEAGAAASCVLLRGSSVVQASAACASPTTFDLTGLPDGTYTVEVHLTDAAGNSGTAAAATYLLDTTAPSAPVLTAPAGPSSSRSWTVSWTGEAGATASCLLRRGSTTVWTGACSSPQLLDLTGLPDGTYTVEVRLTDAAGNPGPAATATYLLDTTAPPAPAFSLEPATSSTRSPRWELTAEAGAVLLCRLVGPDGVVAHDGACSSPFVADLTGLPDGEYTLTVQARDAAGNLSAPTTSAYLLDTVAPSVPTFTVQPPTSFDRSPRWELASDAGSTLLCVLSGPGGVLFDGVCTSPYVGDLSGLPDGDYTLAVRARDAAGNVSAARTSVFVLDTAAPAVPTFTVQPPTSFQRSPRWELAPDAGTTLLCVLTGPGGVLLDGVCTSPYVADLTGLPDGDYTLAVRARDAAGNVSAARTSVFVLDTAAPATPTFSTLPPATAPGRAPTWTFAGDGASTLECRLVGTSGAVTAWTACAGTYTADLSGLPDGAYELRVRARDAAGNLSSLLVGTYLLDTVAPVAVAVTAPASPGSSRSPRWTFIAEAGSTVQCRVDGGAWAPCGSELVLDLTGRPDGDVVVEVRAVDAAGNVGPVTTTTYRLDTTAPASPAFTVVPPTSFDRAPRWSFSTDPGTTLQCRLTGPSGATVFSGACTSPFTGDLTGRPDGTYTLTVTARDAAGNASVPATSTFVLDTVAPSVPVLTAPVTPGNTRTPTWGIASAGTNSCRLLGPSGLVADWAACGDAFTADLTGRPDGTYTLEVRTRDAAGNVSTAASSSYRLDTAPPPAPAVVAPASPSSGSTPSWSVTATEAGTSASCRVLHDGAVVRDWAACTASTSGSAFGFDLSGRPDGTYRLEVRLTDAAGNPGATAGASYVYDTTAPDRVTISAPASPGSTRSPTWRFSSEPGARIECRIGDSGAYAACSGELTVDLSSAVDGTYSVWVRAVDVAGNVGTATRSVYVLDTRAPTAPVVTAPAGPASGTAPSWTWTGEAGATATCELLRDGVRVLSAPCASPWAPTLGADGTYVLTVRLTDAAGNVSAPTSASYVLDTTAPAPPVVAGPSSPNSLSSPTFSFTAESGARTECRLSYAPGAGPPAPLGDWAACASPTSWETTERGRYLVEVRALDAAGNVSAVTGYAYEYDPAAPAGLLELVLAPSPSTQAVPEWSFVAAAGATATCRLVDPSGRVLLDGPCAGAVRPPAALTVDGVYRLTITVTDGVGNVGVNEVLYELDTTGPVAPVVSPRGVQSQDSSVSWSWTGDAAATWQCRLLKDGAVVRGWRTCSPHRQALGGMGEGAYVLEVRGVDALGNVGAIGRGSYRWDATAPAAVVLTSSAGASSSTRQVTWTFDAPADAVQVTCGVRRDRALLQAPVDCSDGSFVMDLGGLAEGRYDLVVLLTDRAGNTREVVGSYTLTAVVGPTPAPTPVTPPPAPRPRPRPAVPTTPPDSEPAPVLPRPLPPAEVDAPTLPVGGGVRALESVADARAAADDGAGTADEGSADGAQAPGEQLGEPVRDEGPPVLGLPEGPVSGARAVEALKDVAGETIRRPTLPLALILLVGLFLLVQNRIDRRDPKLAGAAVDEEPELEFRPVRGLVFLPGGAPA